MKYTDLKEAAYESGDKKEFLKRRPRVDGHALQILDFFLGRKGFDPWWYSIAPEDQDDIFDELRELLIRQAGELATE